ncbi:ATP-dependent helicase HrpB [Shewanella gaetbuli]|uniref:ATP-dependent helicase HrpB n=1 Tax=Shewanella gaetbuli TaxID=220752 RepID=A0A9X2CIK3_9GAMM|nr:ATP-dependent helicase HrpB [Shewanella gaetbuli]MCL1141121.1 ATP-dependent helicase HrpB [Shewanella gaetbuli]
MASDLALPINSVLADILEAIASHHQIILQAPTGAGKSTALPLAILQSGIVAGKIIMLEPRRVATRGVASFIAQQLSQPLGEQVGYRVRGDSKVGKHTQLEVVTEGVLTRMIQDDPELNGVDLIIFDEIHERHLPTDIGLALALEVQSSLREDLTILAMSATLDELELSTLLPEAVTITSEGRSFPVEVLYRPVSSSQDWLAHMASIIVEEVNSGKDTGAILAFLPGQKEINQLAKRLLASISEKVLVCPLYGNLSAAEQDKAIQAAPVGFQKVVLSTNVAESSLTIEGVTTVVDSGYQRSATFNPKTGVSRLSLTRISQASAIQRSGRAGRLSAGKAIRLWSQEEQGRLSKASMPDIMLSELTSTALDCACWGAKQINELALLTPAPKVHEQLAWQLLQRLCLVDTDNKITPLGRKAHDLGCHPRLAHMLLTAKSIAERQQSDLGLLACLIATIVEARGLPAKGADISRYLPIATQGQMGQQAKQWQRKLAIKGELTSVSLQASDYDIGHLLALAFPDRIAKSRGQLGFLLSNGTGVTLAEEDSLAHETFLVVADFQQTQGRNAGRVYLASALDERLLDNELSQLVQQQRHSGWDDKKGRFFASMRTQIGSIVLSDKPDTNISDADITHALMAQIQQQGLSLLNMTDTAKQLQLRVMMAAHLDNVTDKPWPDFSDSGLLATIEQWLKPYLAGVKTLSQLNKVDIDKLLLNFLSWPQQQRLNELAPVNWPMSTGTKAPIYYQLPTNDQGEAYFDLSQTRALLSVRLQEALGLAQSPTIFDGKLTVSMELLSPARRLLATTADLASFWNGPYVEVKKEMRGRYPKHFWPDDPLNANATKFTKKKTPGL